VTILDQVDRLIRELSDYHYCVVTTFPIRRAILGSSKSEILTMNLQQQLEGVLRPHVEEALQTVPPTGPPPGTAMGLTDTAGRITSSVAGVAIRFVVSHIAGEVAGPLHAALVEVQREHPGFDPAIVEERLQALYQRLLPAG
jgi:hypothetical protein